ncbi:MAG: hypothetical protein FWG90_05855 [Oscillospiraceae bacterium]|nr:hypothetical protein [Oscillospiraceae bacterium]
MEKPRKSKVDEILADAKPAKNDPNGSYTGLPIDKNEKPVQDADDL